MTLNGKIAIVTGAAQGIGAATAQRLAADGATVITADIQDAGATVDAILAAGGKAEAHLLDVRVPANWADTVREVIERHGRVDLLANVAGVVNMLSEDSVVGLTEEAWDHVIGTDLKGVWLGMRAVIPNMIERGGGRIVNISSMAALRGFPIVTGGDLRATAGASRPTAPKILAPLRS
ncbi:SDR family NAD(P)-dependent oxidoreductase [Rhodococcus zopfii]|uniref:SDR family NAD(P)-dependent oxidoreductase n=1 Tax=Rhodococcus zopfii TaxID=43772 RepID=UPI000AA4D025|nr:SDR family NAD(P)-dependent oxidoreductase [Rhodococcus zopfii]